MFVTILVGLVIIPVMLHAVKEEGYGVWALLAGGLSYVTILDRALTLAVNRAVAYYHKDQAEMNSYISVSFLILTVMAAITIALTVLLSFVICGIFRSIPLHLYYEARLTCILVGMTYACKMAEANFSGALMGVQYYTRSNIVKVLSNIIRLLLTIGVLYFWKSIIAIQGAFLASAGISAILMYITAVKSIPGLKISFSHITGQAGGEIFKHMKHSIARSGSSLAMYSTLTLLVGWRGTAQDVALYDIASKIPSFMRGFLAAFQNVFLPAVARLAAEGKYEAIKSAVKRATQASSALTYLAAMIMFVFAGDVLDFWLRKSVGAEYIYLMRLLIISIIPGGLFEIWLPTLVGLGYLRFLTVISMGAAAGAIIVTFVLIEFWPLVPVAFSPAIALIATLWLRAGILLPVYSVYRLKIGFVRYFQESILLPLAAGLLSILLIFCCEKVGYIGQASWFFRIILYSLAGGAIFMILPLRREADIIITALKTWRRGRTKGIAL